LLEEEMRFAFVHCHGSGNDFPLIDARGQMLDDRAWASVARALADRNGPVGGDGLLLLGDGAGDAAFAMRMFNSDGSEAETCLNGLRCVARLGFEKLGIEQATIRLKTSTAFAAREHDVAPGVYTVRERAAPASLDPREWPMTVDASRIVDERVPALVSERAFTAVAMPNPHLVCFVEQIDERELAGIGEQCEAAPAWLPNRANVSFVEQRRPDTLFVRTFERGVGLTDSCGSAMAASTYAACLTGRVGWDMPVTVLNKGGLIAASADQGGVVTLSGNATWEWSGEVDVDLDRGIASDLVVEQRFDAEVAAWAAVKERATRGG
jgi:diaminopimelate epimerase